jgi:hypothetical protein
MLRHKRVVGFYPLLALYAVCYKGNQKNEFCSEKEHWKHHRQARP